MVVVNTEDGLFTAFKEFQSKVKDPKKDKKNPHFKSDYVSLDSLLNSTRTLLNEHGLSLVQKVTATDGVLGVETIIAGHGGEYSSGVLSVALPTDIQKVGSCITYMRRYQLSAFLGVASEFDDDGNAAVNTEKKKEPAFDVGEALEKVAKAPTLEELEKAYRAFAVPATQSGNKKVFYDAVNARKAELLDTEGMGV